MVASPQIPSQPRLARIERVRVANCPVDRLSFDEATDEILYRIEMGIPTHVVFVNAAKVVKYRRDRLLGKAMDNAALLLADGVPVVWASHLLGVPLPGRVNGTDLMERLVALAAERGHSVYFLGGTDQVISAAVDVFRQRHPQLRVAGFRNGYFTSRDVTAVVDEINRSAAQILFVGMGTPQKELWGDKVRPDLRVPICQGVGGSFDVIAGQVKRAPLWMQRCGAEWLYRLLQEPRRLFRRYLETNTLFIWMVFLNLLQRR